MKKLVSMVDFVLEQVKLLKTEKNNILQFRNNITDYANFLKQPLTLSMFIPTDENGDVLKEPCLSCSDNCNFDKCLEYQQAKQRVLFEGFELVKDKYKDTLREIVYLPNTHKQVWRKLTYHNGKVEIFFFNYYNDFKTIEDLIPYNLTLTDNVKI